MRLKYVLASLSVILVVIASIGASQTNGFPPDRRIKSHQGYPGQPDVIAHKFVSAGAHLRCIQIESHPKQSDNAACLLKFQNGEKKTLAFNETMQANNDGEVYLECFGDKPTKCTVGIY